jgi:glycosyltransferase involved in cell wall biosynthesis
MSDWLLIAGDFTPLGGMDRANHALAMHLARERTGCVNLVAHRAWPDLAAQPSVRFHPVRRPLGSNLLGAPLVASAGERQARLLRPVHVIANGGNADAGDVTWVHYVHGAHEPQVAGFRRRVLARFAHAYYARRERAALGRARLVLCNSKRTAQDVHERIGIEAARTRVVYYGSDASQFSLVSEQDRTASRRELGWPLDRPVALFVGALGDRRKGFDRLLEAWAILCRDLAWDAHLAVTGHGSELPAWQRRAADLEIAGRITFTGFRTDISRVIGASDVMVHPARYEAYGLGVHEAICRGVPAIVSAGAGIAELYPPSLRDLLIADVEDAPGIADRLHHWRSNAPSAADRIRPLAERLRNRSWTDMGAEIEQAVTA